MAVAHPLITGVILAGGQGSRMNHQDKPLLELGGRPLISHIIDNARSQVDQLLINVNRNMEEYLRFGYPVIGDGSERYTGPLAGVLAAMKWCEQQNQGSGMIACFPGDVPWFPPDHVERLAAALLSSQSETAWLCTDGQMQPLFSMWSTHLRSRLETALQRGVYSPMQFILSTRHMMLKIDKGPVDHFLNINSPEDLAHARGLAILHLPQQLP